MYRNQLPTHYRVAQALSADAPNSGLSTADWKAAVQPIIGGAIMGLVAYSIAKKVGVNDSGAKGVGLALGAVTAIGQLASSWLKGWTDKAIAAAGLAPEAPLPVTVTPTPTVQSGNPGGSLQGLWG
jgi:hypothetical protein